jgi:glycosyltransferase involved in cell wall biosynthesis
VGDFEALPSCLLIECCPKHWELFPAWVNLFRESGYDVDIACPDTAGHLETLALLGIRRLPAERLWDVPFERYDLVLIATLLHEGYNDPDTVQPLLPGLDLVERIGRPSISVIHEPILWSERCPEASFDGRYPGGSGTLNLYPDHSVYWQGRWRKNRRWSWKGERLLLWEDGRRLAFASTDRGATYRGPNGMALLRRPGPRVDLRRHMRSGRHAIVALSRQGAETLNARCSGTAWIVPFESHEGLLPASPAEFVFAGSMNYQTKAVSSLLNACTTLSADESVVVLGGGRNGNCAPSISKLIHDLTALGVEGRVHFTGYLPYGEFVERVRQSRFLLPLVDDRIAAGKYRTGMPNAISLSLGLGVPLIVNETIARRFDLDFMVCYSGEDLASGLAAARAMSEAEYAGLRKRTLNAARRQKDHNLETLAGILRRILP